VLGDEQMPEDGPDDAGVGKERADAHLTVAGRAPERVHLVDPREQLGPPASGAPVGCVVADGAGGTGAPVGRVAPRFLCVFPPVAGGLSSPPGVRREDSMVAMPVDARRWNQACEPIDQLEWAEADPGASVVRGTGQLIDQTGVRGTQRDPRRLGPQAVQREGWAGTVPKAAPATPAR